MSRRLDILIAPHQTMRRCHVGELDASLRSRFDAADLRTLRCGAFDIVLCSDSAWEKQYFEAPGAFAIFEGRWPEPSGLRLTVDQSARSWVLESDALGVRPIYHGVNDLGQPVVSTRPELVAALIDPMPSLDPRAVAQQLMIGYTLNDRTIYQRVRRLRPDERLVSRANHGLTLHHRARCDHHAAAEGLPQGWLPILAQRIVEAFDHGFALELSGGVDSRFVLSLGLREGVKPRMSFTLGHEDDEDVCIARRICNSFGIRHVRIPVKCDPALALADARQFVQCSGYAVNACSYGWLPPAFDHLATYRTAQIGGGGGECASGYYYSPLDFLCRHPRAQRRWVRHRLMRPGVALQTLFSEDCARDLESELIDDVLGCMHNVDGSWRRNSDEFYLAQRVPNAGGPVLAASAAWYEPYQPLLHPAHVEWTRTLTTSQRANRRWQMALIHALTPQLGSIPYSGSRRYANTPAGRLCESMQRSVRVTHRAAKRLCGARSAPDLGACRFAEILANKNSVRASIAGLVQSRDLHLDQSRLAALTSTPEESVHELGVLCSTAWALEDARSLASSLMKNQTDRALRCAA